MRSHPVVGFHVASVHSMELRSATSHLPTSIMLSNVCVEENSHELPYMGRRNVVQRLSAKTADGLPPADIQRRLGYVVVRESMSRCGDQRVTILGLTSVTAVICPRVTDGRARPVPVAGNRAVEPPPASQAFASVGRPPRPSRSGHSPTMPLQLIPRGRRATQPKCDSGWSTCGCRFTSALHLCVHTYGYTDRAGHRLARGIDVTDTCRTYWDDIVSTSLDHAIEDQAPTTMTSVAAVVVARHLTANSLAVDRNVVGLCRQGRRTQRRHSSPGGGPTAEIARPRQIWGGGLSTYANVGPAAREAISLCVIRSRRSSSLEGPSEEGPAYRVAADRWISMQVRGPRSEPDE